MTDSGYFIDVKGEKIEIMASLSPVFYGRKIADVTLCPKMGDPDHKIPIIDTGEGIVGALNTRPVTKDEIVEWLDDDFVTWMDKCRFFGINPHEILEGYV